MYWRLDEPVRWACLRKSSNFVWKNMFFRFRTSISLDTCFKSWDPDAQNRCFARDILTKTIDVHVKTVILLRYFNEFWNPCVKRFRHFSKSLKSIEFLNIFTLVSLKINKNIVFLSIFRSASECHRTHFLNKIAILLRKLLLYKKFKNMMGFWRFRLRILKKASVFDRFTKSADVCATQNVKKHWKYWHFEPEH